MTIGSYLGTALPPSPLTRLALTDLSVIIPSFFAMALGFAVVMSFNGDLHGSHVAPAYVMMCVAIMGLFSACPMLLTWGTNNSAPAGRRAMIASMLTSVANFGGIAGSFMFLDREAPVYRMSRPTIQIQPPPPTQPFFAPPNRVVREPLTRSFF